MNAIEGIEKLQEITDADISEVKQSATIYESVIKELEPYKKLLDIYTADFFLRRQKQSCIHLIDGTRGKPLDVVSGNITLSQSDQELLNSALNLAKDKRFFHWKLEFPEVWYEKGGKKKDGGFDVIIGNPPYLDSKNMTRNIPEERNFIRWKFRTARGDWDMYIPFWELAISLLNSKGYASLITPNKWLSIDYGKYLRDILKEKILKIADFSKVKVFEEQSVYPIVSVVSNQTLSDIEIEIYKNSDELITKNVIQRADVINLTNNFGVLLSQHLKVLLKITKNFKLSQFYNSEEASTVDEAYKLKEQISDCNNKLTDHFKLVNSGTIEKYVSLWGIEETRYLKKSYKKPCIRKQDLQKFSQRRYTQASSKKIIVSGMSKSLKAIIDDKGEFFAAISTVIIREKNKDYSLYFLLGIINSKVATFWLREAFSAISMSGGYINITSKTLEEFPIPKIDFTTRDSSQLNALISEYESLISQSDIQIINFINNNIKTLPSNSAVLHDFLSFLSQKMTELNQNKYLLELFIKGELQEGSEEKIKVIKLLEAHPEWEDRASETRQQEIAKNLIKQYNEKIQKTDKLIDEIVYYLYGLDENDKKEIETALSKN